MESLVLCIFRYNAVFRQRLVASWNEITFFFVSLTLAVYFRLWQHMHTRVKMMMNCRLKLRKLSTSSIMKTQRNRFVYCFIFLPCTVDCRMWCVCACPLSVIIAWVFDKFLISSLWCYFKFLESLDFGVQYIAFFPRHYFEFSYPFQLNFL